jgi:hypothetical protein
MEVSGVVANGTTFNFNMKDGNIVPCILTNVKENEFITFSGGMFGGLVHPKGTIIMTQEGSNRIKIDYSFGITGCIGNIISLVNKKAVVGGTE